MGFNYHELKQLSSQREFKETSPISFSPPGSQTSKNILASSLAEPRDKGRETSKTIHNKKGMAHKNSLEKTQRSAPTLKSKDHQFPRNRKIRFAE